MVLASRLMPRLSRLKALVTSSLENLSSPGDYAWKSRSTLAKEEPWAVSTLFDGEPECSPRVFRIQSSSRLPIFKCNIRDVNDLMLARARLMHVKEKTCSTNTMHWNYAWKLQLYDQLIGCFFNRRITPIAWKDSVSLRSICTSSPGSEFLRIRERVQGRTSWSIQRSNRVADGVKRRGFIDL